MIQKIDADFAWEKTAQLLAIDSPQRLYGPRRRMGARRI